jgi:DNA modification methylase
MSGREILVGDCRDILPTLDAGSVHCVVTSPPYWGLRDYGTAAWDGGDAECDHKRRVQPRNDRPHVSFHGGHETGNYAREPQWKDQCGYCGARRIDRQLGLEPTPEEYVAAMVDVFREVRRVLRDDGTVWLNLGDSYGASGGPQVVQTKNASHGLEGMRGAKTVGSKQLAGIPWRVAFALQADGWYLRSDIIWSKPNPMPESVTDRPTKSHEYVFLLSKRERYYWDAETFADERMGNPGTNGTRRYAPGDRNDVGQPMAWDKGAERGGRNIRSVWNIATQPYPGAHFAVFPEALVVPCIKAGTSERGVCPECGAPWERVVERVNGERAETLNPSRAAIGHTVIPRPASSHQPGWRALAPDTMSTTGWRPSCPHATYAVPATVLDPFAGSGTVGKVAEKLSRQAILIELNGEYVGQVERRTAQVGLGLTG